MVDDDSDDRTVDDWVEEVQPHVDYCVTCQPWESGEVIWILGERQYMGDFLSNFEVPEELQDSVASLLECNNCGAPLDMGSDVGTKSALELEGEERSAECWAAWRTEYEPKLGDFTQFLSSYPYLGCGHEFGQHILDEISKFPTMEIDDESWWRARKPDGARNLSQTDLWPPETPAAEGRYSHYGQRVFYLASTAQASALEVLGDGESLVWIQEYKLIGVKQILNLANYVDERDDGVSVLEFGLDHTDIHRVPPDPTSPWKPQYFLPRFIADCARLKGYQGICFRSHKHIRRNLVLFEWTDAHARPVGKPQSIMIDSDRRPDDAPIEF